MMNEHICFLLAPLDRWTIRLRVAPDDRNGLLIKHQEIRFVIAPFTLHVLMPRVTDFHKRPSVRIVLHE